MTKRAATKDFKARILPYVIDRYGKQDKTAIRTAWHDWTDDLCKAGKITQKQYDTWIAFQGKGVTT